MPDVFEQKRRFIAEVTQSLESQVDGISRNLLKMIISKFVDNLETENGMIKNSPENLNLINSIDSLYQKFMNDQGSRLADTIIGNVSKIGEFNYDYFHSLNTKPAYEATAKQVRQTVDDRLGLGNKTRLKPGGYMDSMLKDTTIRNAIKKLSYQEVLKGAGFQNFKDSLEAYIVGNKSTVGGFKQWYRQYVYDIYVNVDRTEQKLFADALDLQYFVYEGTLIETSRDFCIARAGKVFTLEEAQQWVNDPWIQKNLEKGYISSYDPIHDMGLFGCRHIGRFVSKSVAENLRPDLKGKPAPARKPPVKPEPPAGEEKIIPAGNKIGDQFSKIDAKIRDVVKKALTSIDSVHGDGELKDIPFVRETRKPFLAAFYRNRFTGEPIQIALAASTSKSMAPFSIMHEMGHYLDLYSIGPKGSYSTADKSSPLAPVLKKAMASESIKKILQVLEDKALTIDGIKIKLSSGLQNHLKYLTEPHEIWARAYSQFVAKRSGDAAAMKACRDLDEYLNKYELQSQWSDDEFEDIEKAIEDFMISAGWLSRSK